MTETVEARRGSAKEGRGFFAIGVFQPKREINVGSLWRAAHLYGASFAFTVGHRYGRRQASDVPHMRLHIPLLHFADMSDAADHLPFSCPLIGIEMDSKAIPLGQFLHPERAAYLLGAEDHGLPPEVLHRCQELVEIECPTPYSMNVAAAGSIVMWARHMQARGLSGSFAF